jgi:hypothetical protein
MKWLEQLMDWVSSLISSHIVTNDGLDTWLTTVLKDLWIKRQLPPCALSTDPTGPYGSVRVAVEQGFEMP